MHAANESKNAAEMTNKLDLEREIAIPISDQF